MDANFGISGGGRKAEDLFREFTGAGRTSSSAEGDALLDGSPVEVKRATKSTINQVRAVKYIPLVIYFDPEQAWYVVPAHAVIALVSRKTRGQHTENPFESATLSLANLSPYRIASGADLKEAVRTAVASSARYPQLRDAMRTVLDDSRALAADSVRRVHVLLAELGLAERD